MRIAVVVPVFNGAEFLAETLTAVMAQERAPDEVIVVDDGSTDTTPEVAQRFPVHYIRHAVNRGLGATRNTGIGAAKSGVIALVDADDVWLPHHLGTLEQLLTAHPSAGVAFTRVELFGMFGGTQAQTLPPHQAIDAWERCILENVCIPSTTAFFRELSLSHGGFTEDRTIGRAEDFDFWTRVARHTKMVCSDQVTVRYRKHAAQISAQTIAMREHEYEVRRRLLQRIAAEGDAHVLARVESIMQQALESRFREAWATRRPELMRTYFALSPMVPRGDQVAARWRKRAMLMPLLPLWDRVGFSSIRAAVKRTRG